MTEQNRQRAIRLFVAVLALTALANGLGNNIFSNYFNEAWGVQYVFYLAAMSALFQVAAAAMTEK